MWRKDLDDDVKGLPQAQQPLGTKDDAVAEAPDEVRARLRRRLAERIRAGAGIDRSEEVLFASRGR